MTKETKIGLLVGLTFIILFAIILSKKGPNNSKATATLTVAESDLTDAGARQGGAKPLDRDGKVAVEPMLPNPIQPEAGGRNPVVMLEEEVAQGRLIPGENEEIRPLPESVVSRLNLPMIESPVSVSDDENDDTESSQVAHAVADALNENSTSTANSVPPQRVDSSLANSSRPSLSASSVGTGASQIDPRTGAAVPRNDSINPLLANSRVTNPVGSGQADPASTGNQTGRSAKPTRIIAVHEVKAGESLGKIAAQHYGRATPARIDAIFNANRDQLESVDAVKAKTKLNIPLLEGEFAGMFEPASGLAPPALNASATPRGTALPGTSPASLANGRAPSRDATVRIPIPVDERNHATTANAVLSPLQADSRTPAGDRTAAPPSTPVNTRFTWYEVREKDTLSKIAKRQLGNEKRYRDIFRLNADILPNQHKLKPGMKIRIPEQEKRTTTSAAQLGIAIGAETE